MWEAPKKKYEVPRGLKAAGTALWQRTIDDIQSKWTLEVNDLTILERCARWADDEARLARRVAREGDIVKGSTGSPVVNPAARELRQVRAAITANIKKVQTHRPRALTGHLSKEQRDQRNDQLGDARRNRWAR